MDIGSVMFVAERFESLHALRGLGALIVMFGHLAMTPSHVPPFVYDLIYRTSSPLHFLIQGREAIIFFFVLSGFVLSLPYVDGKKRNYFIYLIQRFFRIYVPYLVAFAVGLLLLSTSPGLNSGTVSELINSSWKTGISSGQIIHHLYAIGYFEPFAVNGVIWTLVHEMRISIVFPFIVLLLMNVRWYYTLIICALLSGIALANLAFGFEVLHGHYASYFDSLHYTSFFILGMVFAKHRHPLMDWFHRLQTNKKICMMIAGFLFYNYAVYPLRLLKKIGIQLPFESLAAEYICAIGIVIFFIAALSSAKAAALLNRRVPLFLGNISYSLYLYHMIILFAVIHHLVDRTNLIYLLALTVVLSFMAACIGFFAVEMPAMALGRRFSRKWRGRTQEQQVAQAA